MKKVLLSILAFVGLMTVTTTVNAETVNEEPISNYFSKITCQIESIDSVFCDFTTKKAFELSEESNVSLYITPTGKETKLFATFDSKQIKMGAYGGETSDITGIIDANSNISLQSDMAPLISSDGTQYSIFNTSFDFIVKIVDKSGNGEKISYTANTSTLTKIETIGTKVEEDKKDETILIPENNTVDSTKFEEVKNNGTKLTVESKKDNKVQYAWIFDGSKMESANFNIDLSLNIGSSANKEDIESLLKNKAESLVLNFAHHGDLPDGTIVRVNVADKYANGDKLKLYYYDETAKELKEEVTDIEVKDGYVQFNLQHCSDYVLEKITQTTTADNKVVSNNAQTSSMNTIIYGALSFVSLVGIAYLVFRKKKEVA